MKTFVILALIAVAVGAPQSPSNEPDAATAPRSSAQQSADATAETLKSVSDVGPESYSYEYETSNGIKANENGQLKQIGEEKGIAAQGGYSYTAPDGTLISVTYVADENGFQPQGDHLPVAPPVPDYILRALEYIKTHAPAEEQQQQTGQ